MAKEFPEYNTNHCTCCGACIRRSYCNDRKYFCIYYPVVPNQTCGEMDLCDGCEDFQKIKGIDEVKAKALMDQMMKEIQEYYAERHPKNPNKVTKAEALAIVDDIDRFICGEIDDVDVEAIKKLRRFVEYSDVFGY